MRLAPTACVRTFMRSYVVIAVLAACGGGSPSSSGDDAPPTDASDGTDDGASGGDGANGDAANDAMVVPPVTCGATTCRVGETCDQNTCKAAPCVGATVPGDYATIQTAATALAAAGNDATICLATQTYTAGNVFLDDAGNHGKTLHIVGAGMDRSKITGRFYVGGGWSKVTFQGVEVTSTSGRSIESTEYMNPDIELLHSRLRGVDGIQISQQANLLVDGCVVDVPGYGIMLLHNTTTVGPLVARIENSYFSGDGDGWAIIDSLNAPGKLTVSVLGSTFRNLDVGIDLRDGITATISNNMFTDITSYAIAWSAAGTVTRTNNALWGNVTNYDGIASDGPGVVKTDCLLSQASPVPGPSVGSPCLGAGDPAHPTSHDFYGVPRGSSQDIGAAEAL